MQISTAEETAQAWHAACKQALYSPRGERHGKIWPRYFEGPSGLKLSCGAVFLCVHGSVGGSERVVVRRYIDALVEVLHNIVPLVGMVADLLSPEIIAAARAALVNHLIANAATAESLALSIQDLSAVELLVGKVSYPAISVHRLDSKRAYRLRCSLDLPVDPWVDIFTTSCHAAERISRNLAVVAIAEFGECPGFHHCNGKRFVLGQPRSNRQSSGAPSDNHIVISSILSRQAEERAVARETRRLLPRESIGLGREGES